jgi:WD40 repeat protein
VCHFIFRPFICFNKNKLSIISLIHRKPLVLKLKKFKAIKMSSSDLMHECQTLLKEINAKEENLKDVASYHFANIRSKIKIQQEYLKNNCNTIALNLINQVNEFESIWLDKLALIKPEYKIEYECMDSLNKTKHILEEKLKVFNSIEFDIEKYTFEGKNANLSTNDLGSLNFNTYIPLIVTAYDSTIKILNVNSGNCLRTLTGHKSYISSIKKISNTQIATSSWDNTIKIWDIKTGECVRNLNEHKSWIECIKIHNGMLITGSGDSTVKFWNLENGVCTKTLVGHSDYISTIKVLFSSKVLQIKKLLTGSGI